MHNTVMRKYCALGWLSVLVWNHCHCWFPAASLVHSNFYPSCWGRNSSSLKSLL